MKKCLPFILFVLAHVSFGQNPNIKRAWHWYFGNGAGIDFSNGIATPDTNGQMYASEGASSISDTSGNLLFYTDGRTVWNQLHHVMPNGTGLLGGTIGSSTQAALIIPLPLSNKIFYIFTVDELPGTNGMRYSIIDMNLDSGNGDIISKNILLFAPSTEKQAAINHCNDTSVWIMGHEINNNHFRSYLISKNGIDTNAVISAIGTPITLSGGYGQMKFSPNGRKIATAMNADLSRMELYDFDNFSGTVYDKIIVSDSNQYLVPVCFSPDNSKLYFGESNGNLYQYDISSNDSAIIVNSKKIIANIVSSGQTGFRIFQNSSDGKIYINHSLITGDTLLSIINSPNNSGSLCNFSFASIFLNGKSASGGLCELNESYFNQTPVIPCTSTTVYEFQNDIIKIFPNPARDWIVLEGKGIKSVEITNVLGSEIDLYPTTASALQNKLIISSLSCGIYFLKINMIDERFVFQKIIVQNY